MKIFLKTEDELELMRQANQLVGKTLGELARNIKPGVTTLELDRIADTFIRDHGAVPTFKGFPNPYGGPFPASICTSVNDVVVHGVPNQETVLKDGDIISVEVADPSKFTAQYDGETGLITIKPLATCSGVNMVVTANGRPGYTSPAPVTIAVTITCS